MPYNKFTIESVKKNFSVKIKADTILFENIKPVKPSELLKNFLEKYSSLGSAIGTEKAKSEFIIAPILAELIEITEHSISLFSGVDFNIDEEKGLNGRCDFIISASPIQYMIEAPVFAVVEAKNDNINSGLGQCMAEMLAVQIFNQNENNLINQIYGVVTTGSIWRFMKLENNEIVIDNKEYFIDSLEKILGILVSIVSKTID